MDVGSTPWAHRKPPNTLSCLLQQRSYPLQGWPLQMKYPQSSALLLSSVVSTSLTFWGLSFAGTLVYPGPS